MNKVYVCSPLSASSEKGIKENMRKAKNYAKKISVMLNTRAIAPHSFLPNFLQDNIPEERELALQFGLDLLKISDAIVVCGNRVSSGMAAEIELARYLEIPVLHYSENECLSTITAEDGWQKTQIFLEKRPVKLEKKRKKVAI